MLREFPPPRLAKQAPNIGYREHRFAANCSGELGLRSRSDTVTFELRGGVGSLEVRSSGGFDVDATFELPVPTGLTTGVSESDRNLVWKVVEVRPTDDTFEAVNDSRTSRSARRTRSFSVVAEIEFNRVRTRNIHVLEFTLDEPGSGPANVYLLRQPIDASAHRLALPTNVTRLSEGRPSADRGGLRRAELTLRCGLTEVDASPR